MTTSDQRACEECGGPINGLYGQRRGRPAKYCSAKCCNRAGQKRASARARAEDAFGRQQPAPAAVPVPAQSPPARPCDNGRAIRHRRAAEGARRGIDPTTCEREYSAEEFEFLKAVERYKREFKRPWPTATELLQIAVSLGYRRVAPAGPLPGAK